MDHHLYYTIGPATFVMRPTGVLSLSYSDQNTSTGTLVELPSNVLFALTLFLHMPGAMEAIHEAEAKRQHESAIKDAYDAERDALNHEPASAHKENATMSKDMPPRPDTISPEDWEWFIGQLKCSLRTVKWTTWTTWTTSTNYASPLTC